MTREEVMRYRGRVTRYRFGAGSKSEHQAVALVTPAETLKLRRPGGNPFHDQALEELVGREIVADGEVHQGQLLMTHWEILGPS